jgi:hypothetical protein
VANSVVELGFGNLGGLMFCVSSKFYFCCMEVVIGVDEG